MKKMFVIIGRIFAFLLLMIFCLPVCLLPKATAVPEWIWIPLAVIEIALIVLFFASKPAARATFIPLLGTLLIAVLSVLVSKWYAMTPPITDQAGNVIAGSIATLEKVELNGSQQWISIRGKDASKPLLLFLAGGPGGTQMSTERYNLAELEDYFVVVNWEQPGAGKSFDAVKRSTITVDRYIEDGHELVQQLKQRFDQEKVYVLGESWGSALGIMLVQKYPEDFFAFIGTGQMIAFLDTDLKDYYFAIDLAKQSDDKAKVEKLVKQGPPPYYGKGMSWKEAAFLMDTYNYMNANPEIARDNGNTFRDLAAPEYGLYDKLCYFLGVIKTLDVVYPQLWDVDFRTQATKLDVPVYFLIGRHDINAPTEFVEQYIEVLDAPHKEIVWFEHSGHNPWVSEADRFVDVMVETVLTQTQP
ncbi:MAG: alpha/beta hydrolase [Chloroflexi bacterium HGW-Chloroflexi-4]|nr:MAG: alpha/beta hydrolase [Chloroflexi bacterium HGW-Chloroflexi-8]PKO01379.1 MAG: alpha/beta hydrolase [Chloroflexi bacterium HGW-Chloroflexi-4]